MKKEQWYNIDGFNNYKVSDLGRVIMKYNGNKVKVVEPYFVNNHIFVSMVDNNDKRTVQKVAVLVFKYVLDIHIDTYYVMYKDADPYNCNKDNIYLIHYSHRSRKRLDKEVVEKIYKLTKNSNLKVKEIASLYDTTEATVYSIRNKKSYTDITDYIDLEDRVKNGNVPDLLKF